MYNLFLDDIRMPYQVGDYISPSLAGDYRTKDWKIVRNYQEFTRYIKKHGLPQLVSFDHDLAAIHYDPKTWAESFSYKEETGMDCAKWLVDYCILNKLKFPEYLVHSQNPIGKENIISYLENYRRHVETIKTT